MTDFERAARWRALGHTGSSSEFIANFMCGLKATGDYPHDPADFGRCARLLALYPEWRARLPEMVSAGPVWAALIARWEEITASMKEEVGLNWERGKSAPRTYRMMRETIEAPETAR